MKPYKDPDEFIKNLGPEEFPKRVDNAVNSFMFEISVIRSEYNMQDPESKTGFYNAAAKKLLEFSVLHSFGNSTFPINLPHL